MQTAACQQDAAQATREGSKRRSRLAQSYASSLLQDVDRDISGTDRSRAISHPGSAYSDVCFHGNKGMDGSTIAKANHIISDVDYPLTRSSSNRNQWVVSDRDQGRAQWLVPGVSNHENALRDECTTPASRIGVNHSVWLNVDFISDSKH
jgi:hypothetical protein